MMRSTSRPGDLAGVLGSLALGVVEVGRDGDDGLLDRLAEIAFGRFLHLLQNEGGNLRRGIFLAVGLDPGVAVIGLDDLVWDQLLVLRDRGVLETPSNQALDREEGVLGVRHRLTLGWNADQRLPVLRKRHHRRRRARPFRVFDDFGVLALHHGHTRVRGAEIDANNFRHAHQPLSFSRDPANRRARISVAFWRPARRRNRSA